MSGYVELCKTRVDNGSWACELGARARGSGSGIFRLRLWHELGIVYQVTSCSRSREISSRPSLPRKNLKLATSSKVTLRFSCINDATASSIDMIQYIWDFALNIIATDYFFPSMHFLCFLVFVAKDKENIFPWPWTYPSSLRFALRLKIAFSIQLERENNFSFRRIVRPWILVAEWAKLPKGNQMVGKAS